MFAVCGFDLFCDILLIILSPWCVVVQQAIVILRGLVNFYVVLFLLYISLCYVNICKNLKHTMFVCYLW